MAIICEAYKTREDGVNLVRTRSDAGVFIQKDGTDEIYVSAIDVEGHAFIYKETGIPINEEVEA